MRPRPAIVQVRGFSLAVIAAVNEPHHAALVPPPRVSDGLEFIVKGEAALPAVSDVALADSAPCAVHSGALFSSLRVRSVDSVAAKTARVRSAPLLQGKRIRTGEPAPKVERVRAATEIFARLPIVRSSDMDTFSQQDLDGFLREAAVLKSMLPGTGELLAVFRRVPVELISSMAYVESPNCLVYRLVSGLKARRTRVHDLAAVRDTSTSKVHLVQHRTKYQTVFLDPWRTFVS